MAWQGTCALLGQAPRVRVGLGLHPELVSERSAEVDMLCALIGEARFIGEVGLDGSRRHRSSLPLQREVFRQIVQKAEAAGGRVMSIHSRGAVSATLDVLERNLLRSTPVLHWFTGTEAELRRASALGCWFSVGPATLRSSRGRRLLAAMPSDRVLTETDGPFGRNGNEPLYPWDADLATHSLSRCWNLDAAATRARLRRNLRRLVDEHHAADTNSVRVNAMSTSASI